MRDVAVVSFASSAVARDEVHMGMRVKAKWADELKPDHTSLLWWEPTGEPDEDYERYKDYL